MSGIGLRLRQERERLGLSQKVFGEIEALKRTHKANTKRRASKAEYLSRVAERGVDLLYVLTGAPTPAQMDNLSQIEEKVLGNYRAMFKEDHNQAVDLYPGRAFADDESERQIKAVAQDS